MATPDTLDQKIILLVEELVGSTPLAPGLPDGDALRRWRDRRRRRLALRSLTAAAAAAAVAVVAVLVNGPPVTSSPGWALAGEINSSWAQVPGHGPVLGISLTCPSTTTCYAEGPRSTEGSVEVTRDAGKTWQAAPTRGGTPLSNIACSSAAECSFFEVSRTGQPTFVETADAGRTWTTRPGPAAMSYAYQLTKGPSGARSYDMGPIDLSCPSPSTCTVVASSYGQPGPSDAFVTTNGGRAWTASFMPWVPAQVQCFSNGRCVSTGETGASYSTDNGLDWSPASVAFGLLNPLSCSGPETCMTVSFPAGGTPAADLVSDNGGESWSPVDTHWLPVGKLFMGLACPTAEECWMAGDTLISVAGGGAMTNERTGGVLLGTSNGGLTWQSSRLPKGITGIDAVSCPNALTCFALAFKGPEIPSSGAPATAPSFALLVYTGRD